jgi:hypothetical protein
MPPMVRLQRLGNDRTMKPAPTSHLRIARPSHDLRASERFWADGLGLDLSYSAPMRRPKAATRC